MTDMGIISAAINLFSSKKINTDWARPGGPRTKSPALPLISKEDYVEARAEWKEKYAALSGQIRELRKRMKRGEGDAQSIAQSSRHEARARANSMMDDLGRLKARAELSYRMQKSIGEELKTA